MKKEIVVYTNNGYNPEKCNGANYRFGAYYFPELHNFDRLCLVGLIDEEAKTVTVGISFCSYPDNFSRVTGYCNAYLKAAEAEGYKPYAVIEITDFTLEACLKGLYDLHDYLITLSVKEVKRLVNQQIVK